ncbi:hypothetical protein ABIE65_000705 [Constrictibacter sp. MBR-5]|jgi:hypothetical protein|uniref:hypothetical protein n=1 Tax=Constrictibacter sp. MBR-5 TaxID=3156467 RepID=UPI003394E1E7
MNYYTRSRHVLAFSADESAISLEIRKNFAQSLFVRDEDSAELPLQTQGSLADSDDLITHIWLPSHDWQPKLGGTSAKPFILPPPIQAYYVRGRWHHSADPAEAHYELPYPEAGSFNASYTQDQPEQRRFIGQLWRLIARCTSNRMYTVDPLTLQPTGYRPNLVWVGHHAIRWCMENDRRVLGRILRPLPEAVARAEAALAGRPEPETPDNGTAYPRPQGPLR